MTLDPTLKSVLETLEDLGKQLGSLNSTPSTETVKGVTEEPTESLPTSRFLSQADQWELRQKLASKSVSELSRMFSIQARKSGTGVPFDM